MGALTFAEIQQDSLVFSIAQAVKLANETATSLGIDPTASLVTISEESSPPHRSWKIHYGPRDFRNRRGGDLIVFVDENAGLVQRVLRGQ